MRTILVTGAAGFIGSNFVRMLMTRGEQAKIIALDKLTYAGNLANLDGLLNDPRLKFVKGDICDANLVASIFDEYKTREVVHFAAESHVDRSILGSGPFIQANVVGTQVLLDVSRAKGVDKYLQVSTDEVYGTLPEDKPEIKFTEENAAGAQQPVQRLQDRGRLPRALLLPHIQPPRPHDALLQQLRPIPLPEKLIPLFVTNLMEGKKVPLYVMA